MNIFGSPEEQTLEQLSQIIEDSKTGFDIDVIDGWYFRIIEFTKEEAPLDLIESISYEQDQLLPMKFKVNCSKRAVPQLIKAIDHFMPEMQYVTQLYFQVVQKIIEKEYKEYNPDPKNPKFGDSN